MVSQFISDVGAVARHPVAAFMGGRIGAQKAAFRMKGIRKRKLGIQQAKLNLKKFKVGELSLSKGFGGARTLEANKPINMARRAGRRVTQAKLYREMKIGAMLRKHGLVTAGTVAALGVGAHLLNQKRKELSLANADGQPKQVVKQFVQNNDITVPEQQDPDMMCDATAIAVAQIFDLDLSGCSSADEGTELICSTCNKFIQLFQQVQQELSQCQQQCDEHAETIDQMNQDQNPVDENGQPVDPDVDENGNSINPDENDIDGEGDPQGQQDDPPGDTAPNSKPKPKPAFGKAKSKSSLAAGFDSIDGRTLKLAAENRKMKINQLAAEGILTPHAARMLADKYTSTKALTLSLSSDDESPDNFDFVLDTLRQNGPIINYGESAMSDQTRFRPLEMSHGNKKPKNIMVEDAESRQKGK